VPFEGGEDDTAFQRLVAMLEQEARHAASLRTTPTSDIGAPP
jgi:hypothetical protein